eukprot:m51a1_g8639 hypothetical protein (99) ;mRNA; f:538-923
MRTATAGSRTPRASRATRVIRECTEAYGRGLITADEGAAKAREIGATKYVEASALLGHGVAEVFYEAVSAVVVSRTPVAASSAGRMMRAQQRNSCLVA